MTSGPPVRRITTCWYFMETTPLRGSCRGAWSIVSVTGRAADADTSIVQRLPSREARLDGVPPAHAILAELPAEVDLAPVAQGGEVNQASVEVFHQDAPRLNPFNALGDALVHAVQLVARLPLIVLGQMAVAGHFLALDDQPRGQLRCRQPQRLDLAQLRLDLWQQRLGLLAGEVRGHACRTASLMGRMRAMTTRRRSSLFARDGDDRAGAGAGVRADDGAEREMLDGAVPERARHALELLANGGVALGHGDRLQLAQAGNDLADALLRFRARAHLLQRHYLRVAHLQQRLDIEQRAEQGLGVADAPAAAQVLQRVEYGDQVNAPQQALRMLLELGKAGALARFLSENLGRQADAGVDAARVQHLDGHASCRRGSVGGGARDRVGRAQVAADVQREDARRALGDQLAEDLLEEARRRRGGGGELGALGHLAIERRAVHVHAIAEGVVAKMDRERDHRDTQLARPIRGDVRRAVNDDTYCHDSPPCIQCATRMNGRLYTLLRRDDVGVVWLAALHNLDLRSWVSLFDAPGRLVGGLRRHARAEVDRQDLALAGIQTADRVEQHGAHLVAGGDEPVVDQADDVALVDADAINLHGADRLGDLGDLHARDRALHRTAVGVEIGLEVEGEQRAHALRQRVGRDDVDLLGGELRHLPCAQNDVAVVGQQDDLLGRAGLHRFQQLLGAGVHRLATGHDGGDSQALEDLDPALAGRHRDGPDLPNGTALGQQRGRRCCHGCACSAAGRSGSRVGAVGVPDHAALARALGRVAQALLLEVLDVDVLQAAQAHTIIEHFARCGRVR